MGICPLFIGVEMCEGCPCHVGTKFKASGSHWGTSMLAGELRTLDYVVAHQPRLGPNTYDSLFKITLYIKYNVTNTICIITTLFANHNVPLLLSKTIFLLIVYLKKVNITTHCSKIRLRRGIQECT